MRWANRNVLVTGGSGFIGSHLVEQLVKKKSNVRVLSVDGYGHIAHIKSDIKLVDCNITKPLYKVVDDVDVIFHLAAFTNIKESVKNPKRTFKINTYGTVNLLEAVRGAETEKFIYLSTSGVYGVPKYTPLNEDHPVMPVEPYAASKLAGENFVLAYGLSYDIPASVARSFNVYGPRQNPKMLIPSVIRQVLSKNQIELGNLKSTRDFIYVSDVISGLFAVAERGRNTVYNFGTGVESSVEDIVKIILRILGKKTQIKVSENKIRDKKVDVPRNFANISKAKKDLNWSPTVMLEDGLSKTVDYYKVV